MVLVPSTRLNWVVLTGLPAHLKGPDRYWMRMWDISDTANCCVGSNGAWEWLEEFIFADNRKARYFGIELCVSSVFGCGCGTGSDLGTLSHL